MNKDSGSQKSETLNRGAIPTTSALVVRETSGNQKKMCEHCKGEHYLASCEKVKEVTTRKDVLRKEGRCFLCLTNGHRDADIAVETPSVVVHTERR